MRRSIPTFDTETETFLRAFLHAARNVMQREQVALSLLRLEAEDRPGLLDLITDAERESDDLTSLFDAARRYASPVELKPVSLDVSALLEEAWRRVRPDEAGAALGPGADPAVWTADPNLLRGAFEEILRNAFDARPRGLRLSARWREVMSDGGRVLELRLADNGPGLTDTARQHAFEPFWSARPGRRGMGLPMARRAVAAHGGILSLEDADGGGVEAILTLPPPSRPARAGSARRR